MLVTHLHHEHPDVDTEHLAGQRQRTAPLAGTGFGRHAADTGFTVVVRLGNGRIELVAAGRTDAFVLVVNPRRSTQFGFEPVGPEQRSRPPEPVDFPHRFRNRNPAFSRHFLLDQAVDKDG